MLLAEQTMVQTYLEVPMIRPGVARKHRLKETFVQHGLPGFVGVQQVIGALVKGPEPLRGRRGNARGDGQRVHDWCGLELHLHAHTCQGAAKGVYSDLEKQRGSDVQSSVTISTDAHRLAAIPCGHSVDLLYYCLLKNILFSCILCLYEHGEKRWMV